MRTRALLVAALVAFLSGTVSQVWAEKGDMHVRFGVLANIPTDDLVDAGQTTELDDAFGFQVSFEYLVTDKIGVEPAIGSAGHDVTVMEAGVPDQDFDIDWLALTANVNFHVLPEKSFDLFVGPTIGYAFWGDLESDVFGLDFPTDDEFVYGFNVGVDVPLGEGGWSFTAAISYLFTEVSPEGSSLAIGVDPLQLKAGAAYAF